MAVPLSIDGSPPGSAVNRSCPNTGRKIEKALKIGAELFDSAFAGWKIRQRYQQENRPIQKTSYFLNVIRMLLFPRFGSRQRRFPIRYGMIRSWRIFFAIADVESDVR